MPSKNIIAAIKAGSGTPKLSPVAGVALSARLSGNSVVINDGKGGQCAVTTVDVIPSCGIFNVINSVLQP